MAFFNSYWDVSGKIHDSPFLVMAGYVAPATQWGIFVQKWSEILNREHLTHWHMTDFNAREGEYSKWKGNTERCDRVYRELIDIIKKYADVGVVSAVEVETYKKTVIGEELQRHFGEHPYKFCLLNCLVQVNEWLKKNAISEDVAYILECGDDGYEEVNATLSGFFKDENSLKQWQLGTLSTVKKKSPEAIPCQAGDILAWECRRELVERRKTTPRNTRLSLERLLVPSTTDVVWDKNTLPLMIASMVASFKEGNS